MFARFFPNQRLTAPATKREEPPPPPRRTTYTDLVRDLKSGKVDGIMLGVDTNSALYTDQDGSVNQTIVSKNEEFGAYSWIRAPTSNSYRPHLRRTVEPSSPPSSCGFSSS